MATGKLTLDPNYISAKRAKGTTGTLAWSDQPEHTVVYFQYDPKDVKINVRSKWSPGNKEKDADLDMNIPWNWEKGSAPNTMNLKLTFNDFDPTAKDDTPEPTGPTTKADGSGKKDTDKKQTTQSALAILEAMSLPVNELWVEELKDFDIIDPKKIHFPLWHQWVTARERESAGDPLDPKKLKPIKPLNPAEIQHGVQVDTVSGFRFIDGIWHPPRPLILTLVTRESYKCVITKLEIDINGMDNATGQVTIADANVTLAEWPEYKPNTGLVVAKGQPIAKVTDISEWNRKVRSGEWVQTTPSKSEFVANYFLKSKKGTEK